MRQLVQRGEIVRWFNGPQDRGGQLPGPGTAVAPDIGYGAFNVVRRGPFGDHRQFRFGIRGESVDADDRLDTELRDVQGMPGEVRQACAHGLDVFFTQLLQGHSPVHFQARMVATMTTVSGSHPA